MSIFVILDLWNYLQDLHTLVGNLYKRMSKIQDNLKEILAILKSWSSKPLFERKEGKKVSQYSHSITFLEIYILMLLSYF